MARRASSRSQPRPRPILCAVLDVAAFGPRPEARALDLFRAGVDWIQLRDREVPAASLYQTSRALVRAREGSLRESDRDPLRVDPRVILNRRVDVALATGADGVQLGFDAMEPSQARTLLGATALVGVSLHGANEALDVMRAADEPGRESGSLRAKPAHGLYGQLAPIWDPRSKPASRPALGLGEFERACATGLPILAQGGLDADRAVQALGAGAAGIAVTGEVVQSADPAEAVRRLRRALDRRPA